MGTSHSNENQNEVVYGTSINGQALGDIMSNRENEMIFNLPRQFKNSDKVEVMGSMTSNPKRLVIAFITGTYKIDHNNVACEIEFNFTDDESIKLRKIINGVPEEQLFENGTASELFMGAEFKLTFEILTTQKTILISVGDSFLDSFNVEHNIEDIKYLSLSNDILKVSNLNFTFTN